MSAVELQKEIIAQLKRETHTKREKISVVATDFIKHVTDKQTEDVLFTGFKNENDNPLKVGGGCILS
jgi:16S rRNA A1518/A1519 N6-dimethyltransferase RsmA/KsgA/DIM1 with predicted DNA glycosylase/AP lyase activity